MADPTYARTGYRFYSVITPSVAVEHELPSDEGKAFSPRQKALWQTLEDTAEAHRTHIQSSPYALLGMLTGKTH